MVNKRPENTVTVIELLRLLADLKDLQPGTSIRIRRIGEMWFPMFMRIVVVTGQGVVLNDEVNGKIHVVENLVGVMQFEIDQVFRNYQPHCHYDVVPFVEYN